MIIFTLAVTGGAASWAHKGWSRIISTEYQAHAGRLGIDSLRQIAHLLLDDTVGFPDACSMIRSLFDARTEVAVTGNRYYLDTADRRLLHRSMVLECDVDRHSTVLSLRGRKTVAAGPIRQASLPGSAADIVDFDLRRRLRRATGSAELAIVCSRPLRYELMRVRNKNEKTIARLYVEQFGADRPSERDAPVTVRLMALRGYRNNARKAAHALREHLPLDDAPAEHVAMALDRASARPPDCLMVQDPVISRKASIAEAVIEILAINYRVVTSRAKGIQADLDIKFLHDFRIALRRMRSLLNAFGSIFVPQAAAILKSNLRWLNQATGTRRDLDVYINRFPQLIRSVTPENRASLRDMRQFISGERRREQEQLVLALRSPRYAAFMVQWSEFLSAPSLIPAAANQPVSGQAGSSIWKTYKGIRQQIPLPRGAGRIDALHALRKDCKELRYQIEAFKSLFSKRKLAKAVDELKHLQDILGEVCDNSVQQRSLIRRRSSVLRQIRDPASMEKLVQELLCRHADEERRLLRITTRCLHRFANKRVTQTYRRLFRPHTK